MQKWEYKIIRNSRGAKGSLTGRCEATPWKTDMTNLLPGLGAEGWELVAIESRSGYGGDDWAGFTTEDIWVFKRPIE